MLYCELTFFFITCAKEPIYKKSIENHDFDFLCGESFFDFHSFFCVEKTCGIDIDPIISN